MSRSMPWSAVVTGWSPRANDLVDAGELDDGLAGHAAFVAPGPGVSGLAAVAQDDGSAATIRRKNDDPEERRVADRRPQLLGAR